MDRRTEHQRHQISAENSQHGPNRRADQTLQADLFQPDFKKDDACAENQTTRCRQPRRYVERVQSIRGNSQNQNENGTNNDEIEQLSTPSGRVPHSKMKSVPESEP